MKNKTKSGFTLVELIVVIAILGILVLITLPKFQQYVKQAEVRKELANAKTVYTAALAYDQSNGTEKDMHSDYISLYSWERQESLIQPYLSDDIKMIPYGWEVNEPGEYNVYKTPNFADENGNYKMQYMVYYFDPRIHTAGSPFTYPQTVLLDGVPVIYGYGTTMGIDANGNSYVKYMTVEEYLEEKALEEEQN